MFTIGVGEKLRHENKQMLRLKNETIKCTNFNSIESKESLDFYRRGTPQQTDKNLLKKKSLDLSPNQEDRGVFYLLKHI